MLLERGLGGGVGETGFETDAKVGGDGEELAVHFANERSAKRWGARGKAEAHFIPMFSLANAAQATLKSLPNLT